MAKAKAFDPGEQRIEWMDIDALRPFPGNPKTHAADVMGRSVEEFGYADPILMEETTGFIVKGHGRLEALQERKKAGLAAPDRVRVDGDRWMVAVIRGLRLRNKRHAARYLAADNRIGEIGGYDNAMLAKMLSAFEVTDFVGTGFNESDLARFMSFADPLAGKTDPDNVPDVPTSAVSKTGDLWILGDHAILCGDSTKEDDVRRVMGGARAVLMATDPPYGDSWVQKARDMDRLGYVHSPTAKAVEMENDSLSDKGLKDLLDRFLSAARVAGTAPMPAYIWHGSKRLLFEQAMLDAGYLVHQTVIWVKPSFVIGRLHYHPRCEGALHGWLRGGGKCPFFGERNQSDVWEVARENDKVHPTQKPVELFAIPMRNHVKRGEVCYEPFSGSGTQIIAGEQTERAVRAIEIDPRYVDVAVERWQNFTGKKAVRKAGASGAPSKKTRRPSVAKAPDPAAAPAPPAAE